MGYNKPNPLKMMDSALKMYKAEKKGGMHRMESPMYATEASRELKYMPIDDRASDDRIADSGTIKSENNRFADSGTIKETSGPAKKDSPANNMDHKEMSAKELHQHGMVHHPAKPPKGSPAMNYDTAKGSHDHPHSPMNRQGYNDKLDESLAKDGKESSKKQSMKDRRDESKGMEKSKGKGAYSSDPKMS